MGLKYAVIGSGKQGTASAYDFVKFGDAEQVLMIDFDLQQAEKAADFVNNLVGQNICIPKQADVTDISAIKLLLKDVDSAISGVPYYFNYALTLAAIETKTSLIDFGGNTPIVEKQLALNKEAAVSGINIIPDCGMGPGMNISMAEYVMSQFDKPEEIHVYDGGLPKEPKPPWNYELHFHINGLTNEYFGNALFLRNGKVTEVKCLTELEDVHFDEPLGKLEAAVTSGGLSTAPITFENKVKIFENKTLRYPGHWQQFKAFQNLGLFELEPISIKGNEIIPRDVFHSLLEPKIMVADSKDICVIRVVGKGKIGGENKIFTIDLSDEFDESSGFTAMQRLTGWHASIMAILAAKGKIERGAVPVEKAVRGKMIIEEAEKRGLTFTEKWKDQHSEQ